MLDELRIALHGIIPEERIRVFLEAQQLLSSIGLSSFEDELQNIIGMQDGISDNYLFVGRIQDVLIYALGDSLTQYGITVEENTTIPVMLGILQAVANVENYVIPQTLYDMTLSDWTPEELVSEMTPMFSDITGAEAFDAIVKVDDAVVTRLREITSQATEQNAEDLPHRDAKTGAIKRINALLNATNHHHPQLVVEMAKSGIPSGQPLEVLLGETLETLDTLPTDKLALELLGLVFYSGSEPEEIGDVLKATIRDFTDDYQEQVRIEKAIEATWGEV